MRRAPSSRKRVWQAAPRSTWPGQRHGGWPSPRHDNCSGAFRSRGDASCCGWRAGRRHAPATRALAPETHGTSPQRLGKTLLRASLTAALRSRSAPCCCRLQRLGLGLPWRGGTQRGAEKNPRHRCEPSAQSRPARLNCPALARYVITGERAPAETRAVYASADEALRLRTDLTPRRPVGETWDTMRVRGASGRLLWHGAPCPGLTGTGGTTMFHPQGPTVWELLVQGLSSTEQGYDLLAPKFDSTPFGPRRRFWARRWHDWVDERALPRRWICAVARGPPSATSGLCVATAWSALTSVKGCWRSRAGRRRRPGRAPHRPPAWACAGDAVSRAAFELVVCFGAFGHILPGAGPVRRPSRARAHAWGPVGMCHNSMATVVVCAVLAHPGVQCPHARAELAPYTPFYYVLSDLALPGSRHTAAPHGFAVTVYADIFPGCFQPVRLVIETLTTQARITRPARRAPPAA